MDTMQGDVIEVRADGRQRARREYSEAYKRRLVALTQAAGASVSRIAQQHKVNANLLFAWRRQFGAPAKLRTRRTKPTPTQPALLPVTVESHAVELEADRASGQRSRSDGCIEIEIGQSCVRVRGAVDLAALETVLRALERSR
jgi:transposase